MAKYNQNDITFFAKTNFRNQGRIFGIKTDDRRRHMYVIGKTGMGKTNLLENLAIQDIQKGHGIAFIDPHGDTAEKLIKAIPSNRINDVIYLNPSDQDFPIAFNVMEKVDPEYRHLVASGLVGVFKKIWADSWGPRLEYILRNAILALLEYPGSTLLGVTRILVDKSYRAKVVEKITDPVVRSFWVDEFSQWNDRVLQEVISPIQNKVGQFLSSSLIRNIVGQTVSSFNIREVMDQRKILIINLSKGRIGEDNGALLGAMMITKIQLAAMGRVDIPEEERKDFYLYVDEFQNFATESFANILSEARKYHLNLVLANQYVTQIEETVRDAIFGNAGSIISFRVGAMDAEFLEKEFEPVFMMNDIINLPKYQIYLKLMIDGIAGDAFSATTLPPIKLEDAGNESKIIQSSRERYSSSREEVEEKIRRWSGMLTLEERQAIMESQKPVTPSIPTGSSSLATHPSRRAGDKGRTPPLQTSFHPALAPKRDSVVSLEASKQKTTFIQGIVKAGDEGGKTEEGTQEGLIEERRGERTEEKKMYEAKCVNCDEDIQIPFKPDGKRPTFCKDCLRDYQRSVAKVRIEAERKEINTIQSVSPQPSLSQRKESYHKSYVSSETPISLHQVGYISAKKFQSLGHRPAVNLHEVRSMIQNVRRSNKEE